MSPFEPPCIMPEHEKDPPAVLRDAWLALRSFLEWQPVERGLPGIVMNPSGLSGRSGMKRVTVRTPDGARYVTRARLVRSLGLEIWEPLVLGHEVVAWLPDDDLQPYRG